MRLVARLAAAGLLVGGLAALAAPAPAQAAAARQPLTFAGAGFGAVPDDSAGCLWPGTPRDVTFDVSGLRAGAPADVRVTGLAVTHPYVGDLSVTLIAPGGASAVLFGSTGTTTAPDGAEGSGAHVAGPYTFADDATGDWWSAAASQETVPAGGYRTSRPGPGADGGQVTGLTDAFSGTTEPNGTWTLRFTDNCGELAGSVTAATLSLVPAAPDCTTEQGAVAAAEAAVESATEQVAAAQALLDSATTALAGAEQRRAAADRALADARAGLPAAEAASARAQRRHTRAARVERRAVAARAAAGRRLHQALARLTEAEASGTPSDVARARGVVRDARLALRAARHEARDAHAAAVAAAQQAASAAGGEAATRAAVQSAQERAVAEAAAVTRAAAAVADAQAALAAAQDALDGARTALADAQDELAVCQASRPATGGRPGA